MFEALCPRSMIVVQIGKPFGLFTLRRRPGRQENERNRFARLIKAIEVISMREGNAALLPSRFVTLASRYRHIASRSRDVCRHA
jgi:hypothetical protein